MPINSLERNKQLPRLGKIRLGIKKQSRKGTQYPDTVPYFVLKDAPDVVAEYGENPTSIDIIFPHRDRNIVLPTWFRWYGGGYRDNNGDIVGGELYCRGTGTQEGGEPGVASYYAGRDPISRVIPNRPCLEKSCPDFYDKKGQQQCKAGMKVIAVVIKREKDEVLSGGVFHIDTTSWESMGNFISVFDWALSRPEYYDIFTSLPFTIYREETKKKITDAQGNKTSSTQYIMKLKVNTERLERLRSQGFFAKTRQDLQLTNSDADILDALPMEDHYMLPQEIEGGDALAQEIQNDRQKIDHAAELMKDPDFIQKVEDLEKVTGKKLTDKQKLIAIRQKEGAPDLKMAVLESIHASILKTLEAQGKAKAEEAKIQNGKPKEKDSEGII